MKTIFLSAIFFGLLFISCKKKEVKNPASPPASANYMPSTVGSWWVYETFTIDSNGVETTTGIIDSVFIIGDTVVNNKSYVIYQGTNMGIQFTSYKRDSSGYIVNLAGQVEYNYVNFTDTMGYDFDGMFNRFTKMVNTMSSPLTVPAGLFTTIDRQTVFSDPGGNPVNNCGDYTYVMHANYDKEIGLVRSCCPYYIEMVNCGDRQRKLIDYYLP